MEKHIVIERFYCTSQTTAYVRDETDGFYSKKRGGIAFASKSSANGVSSRSYHSVVAPPFYVSISTVRCTVPAVPILVAAAPFVYRLAEKDRILISWQARIHRWYLTASLSKRTLYYSLHMILTLVLRIYHTCMLTGRSCLPEMRARSWFSDTTGLTRQRRSANICPRVLVFVVPDSVCKPTLGRYLSETLDFVLV